jgi:hypothetical protein
MFIVKSRCVGSPLVSRKLAGVQSLFLDLEFTVNGACRGRVMCLWFSAAYAMPALTLQLSTLLRGSHSGLLEPRGTSTVRKAPGVRDITIWSVIP